jgi:hypothetical protein
MGACQGTGKRGCPTRGRRPRPRRCMRKGCGRTYQPRRWNQRYCQDPECLRQVRQWQAARRQAKRRQAAEAKARHAQAEKARRQRAKATSQAIENPKVAPPRGHAAETFFLLHCAIGRAATNTPRARPATGHGTVAPPAVRRFATSRTGNASGLLAAPWMVVRRGRSSTRPHADVACFATATPLARHHRGHLRSDDSPRAAPVVNYRVALLGAG